MSVIGDKETSKPVTILRDTGAIQSLMLSDVLTLSDKTDTCTRMLIQGVEMGCVSAPLHNVNLISDISSGPVTVAVRPSLPVEGVTFILGNDIAGEKVMTYPKVTAVPSGDCDTENLDVICPGIFPGCAVTRSMSKVKSQEKDNDNELIDLSETFFSQLTDGPDDKISPRAKLIYQQENELLRLRNIALTESEAENESVCFYLKDNVLMRKWRPTDSPPDDGWKVVNQVVIPPSYRSDILSLGHELPLAGHLGIKKTFKRIMCQFYWPGLKTDVIEYCRTYHTCQIVGKPNENISAAPLKPIPAVGEPFSRVIVDCLGPLPRTKSGNRFILTIMCAATRFPEAIPLRNITTKNVVKVLIRFFSFVGLPASLQSDQASNFLSEVFQQVMHQLNIKQYKSSACHPESQGALERFHQTMKTILKTYCLKNDKDWDEGVPLMLFAIRESVQESLGFSPFEFLATPSEGH